MSFLYLLRYNESMENLHLKIKQLKQDRQLMPHKKKIIDMQIRLLEIAIEKSRQPKPPRQSMDAMVRELFF